jgi:WD40-like Beta Propeller Repeat
VKLRLTGQPFQVLAILLERPGEVNTAINKIREVLGDSAEGPRFVETLPRRGYRFVARVRVPRLPTEVAAQARGRSRKYRGFDPHRSCSLSLSCSRLRGFSFTKRLRGTAPPAQRALTRLTFDDGLQIGATWSPDGRFIAYSSNRRGKFDIWVQQVSGCDPVQITKGPGQNWQPDWSSDGKHIAYRSEDGDGGLFVGQR